MCDNLCYGSDRAVSDDALWAVLVAAHADFVRDLPHGLESPIGERGLCLSGGQRQRLVIARALLRDPRFLLLDEATSQLDAESEHHVQAALFQIMQGRTTLVIAHRFTTVMNADQIVVLEKGKITGIGTHQELLSRNQCYRNLIEHQLQAEPCIT